MVMTMMHGRAAIIGHRQSLVTVVSFMFKGSILEINRVLVAISITCTIRRVTVENNGYSRYRKLTFAVLPPK